MKRALIALLLFGGCADGTLELTLDIRESSDRRLFASIDSLHLIAERDDRTLVDQPFPSTATSVSVSGVPYGARTVFTLQGISMNGDVVARGSTCPIDFLAPGNSASSPTHASLYFTPTNDFASTAGEPLLVRSGAVALTRPSGDVLVSGGLVDGAVVGSAEVFTVSTSTFAVSDATLSTARAEAQVNQIAGVGALITGGHLADGTPVATAEVFHDDTGLFSAFESTALGPRSGHQAILVSDDQVLVTGGTADIGGAPLQTTALIRLQPDGSATVAASAMMIHARRAHASVLVSGVPVLIGGYGDDGNPLASLEVLRPTDPATPPVFAETPAPLRTARAEATATVLADGTILVVGGAGDAAGTPLPDGEVYNAITAQTVVHPLTQPRRQHTATALPDGRVLVVGGIGTNGAPLSSVELFIPNVGFVAERPLVTPRAGHRVVPLCDGTVLVVGGGRGAELYAPPP